MARKKRKQIIDKYLGVSVVLSKEKVCLKGGVQLYTFSHSDDQNVFLIYIWSTSTDPDL